LAGRFAAAYQLRSDLVRGSLSPFDPEVEERCGLSMQLAERVLCSALGFFESQGLFDRSLTNTELAVGFDRLTGWTKSIDAGRREPLPQETGTDLR
jgi:hypothetical protein